MVGMYFKHPAMFIFCQGVKITPVLFIADFDFCNSTLKTGHNFAISYQPLICQVVRGSSYQF